MRKIKILLLTNILAPYRIPLFNILGEILDQAGFEFKIAFMAENEQNRDWRIRKDEIKVPHTILRGWNYFVKEFELPIHINWNIWQFLRKESPSVIISGGYSSLSNWIALVYCKLHHKKLILWTGTTPECIRGRDPVRSYLRKIFIKASDAFVTYGKRAADFLKGFGVPPEAIFIGCNVGDIEFFRSAVAEYRMNPDFPRERKKFKGPVLLYVGQLIRRKGLLQLIEALSELKALSWDLIIVGSGPLQEELLRRSKEKSIESRIHFLGFHEKEELVKFYALADIFVLPSLQEPYAIVISEALSSGLFTISSQYDGASWDLITEKNGIIVDPLSKENLRSAIITALNRVTHPGFRREEIVQSIRQISIDNYAQAFIKAIEYVYS